MLYIYSTIELQELKPVFKSLKLKHMNKKITVSNSLLYVNFIRIDQDMTSEDMFVIAWFYMEYLEKYRK